LQVTATTAVVVPVMEPGPAKFELATCVAEQALAEHVTALKVPAVEQVTAPPPEYPTLQLTDSDWPVVPVIEPVVA